MLKMKPFVLKLLWLLLGLVKLSHEASPSKLIFNKAEISKYDESVMNVTFKFENLPNDSYSFNFYSELYVELDAFLVRVGIALQTADGKYNTMVKGSVADICKYYRDNSTNMFLRLFFNGHFGKKVFPTSCPIKPGVFIMEDFQLNEDFLKIRVFETKFLVHIDMCTKVDSKLKCFLNMKIYGEMRDRQRWEKEVASKVT